MRKKYYDYEGKKYNINEICSIAGRSRTSFDMLTKKGLTPKQIINTPIAYGRKKFYEYNGKKYDIDEICKIADRSRSSFDILIRKGLTPEEIVNNKPNYHCHGMADTKLYRVYRSMLNRCINVCDEWRNDPTTFFKWAMNNGYKEGLSIDRIDNNKGYSPDNCRWATSFERCHNRRGSFMLRYNDTWLTVTEIAKIENVSYQSVYSRYIANKKHRLPIKYLYKEVK